MNFIRKEIENNVATLVIDRPEKMNALNTNILNELLKNLYELEQDDNIRVVVLRGQGEKAFIAGADIQELSGIGAYDYRKFGLLFTQITEKIISLPKPVIAAVNGVAYGGGCLIAISCDLVLADENAKFGFQEVNLGFMGATGFLPKLIGKHRAAELTMLGEVFSVQDASRFGLVNRIAPKGELNRMVEDVCERLIAKSDISLHLIKKSLMVSLEAGLSISNRYETEVSSICVASAPAQRRIARYLKK